MAGTSQCSVGLILKSNCHKLTFTNHIGINFFQDEQNLVALRSGLFPVLIIDICFHHQKFLRSSLRFRINAVIRC